jgi:hypothetical protein
MGWRRGIGIAAAFTAATLNIAPSASAATEVGNACEANSSVIVGFEGILFPLTNGSSSAIPVSVPAAGVATRWTARQRPGPDTHFVRLKVLRLVPGANRVQVVAESPSEGVAEGHESFPIRIPVQVGDRFGLSGPGGALGCSPSPAGDVAGATTAGGAPGATEAFYEIPTSQAAVSVSVEPDVDGDGYGDESQDSCPEVAALQTGCPPVALTVDSATVKQRAILVAVEVSSQAQVQAFGQVSWQVRQKVGANRGLTAGLSAGAAHTVTPGTVANFRLPLTKSVVRRLGRLSPRQALQARITVRTTDLAGRESDRQLTAKLPGRKR